MPGVTQEGFDPLDSLESQIEELERRILGNCEITEKEPHIIDSLVQSNATINNATSSHNSIKTLFDRLDQLGKFLDPSFEDSLIDIACKKKVVLDSENEVRQYLLQSKKLCELNNSLNGDPFKKVPTLIEKLRKVSQESIQVQSDYEKLKKEIEALSENYTDAVKALTGTFLFFDTQLAEIEGKNKEKEPLDVPIEE